MDKIILPEKQLIESSLEWKLASFEEAISEWNRRKNYFYYQYDPYREGIKEQKYIDFHLCGKKARIAKGAPRSGKTVVVFMDHAMITLGEHPVYSTKDSRYHIPECNTGWVIAENYKKVYRADGLLEKFLKCSPDNRVTKVINDDKRNRYEITYDTGSTVTFLSQENPDDFSSASVHWVIVDERVKNEKTRTQIRSRVLDTNGLMSFTMDSMEEDEWVDEWGKKDYGKLFLFELEDNAKYLPKEEIDRIKNDSDEIEKERLLYGRSRERNVNYVFKPEIWSKSNYVEIAPARYDFDSEGNLVSNEKGIVRIYKRPEPDCKYAIGVDPAKGVGQNSHGIIVLNAETGEQCCTVIDNQISFVILDDVLLKHLGKYYNNALIVVENKYHGETIIAKLQMYYPNLFFQAEMNANKIVQKGFGIRTDENNKSQMAGMTRQDIIDGKLLLHCHLTKLQLDNFLEIKTGEDNQKGEKTFLKGQRVKGNEDLKNSDDDLTMSLLLVDKAINDWGLLKTVNRNDTKRVLNLDEIKKHEITFIQNGSYEPETFSEYVW